jgi:murein DD-endopeptidase MepM/ murein hydrolase activator NlpD
VRLRGAPLGHVQGLSPDTAAADVARTGPVGGTGRKGDVQGLSLDTAPEDASVSAAASRRPGAGEPGRLPRFELEPEHMAGHRTTARGILLLALTTAALAVSDASAYNPVDQTPGRANAAPIVFPVVGAVTYGDDWGDPRGNGRHAGNDIVAARRALAVAAEDGKVKFWTTSSRAGCMLYLYGASGTTYLYIHLNNDLTNGNDNRGKCVAGVAYANGLKSGAKVRAGQPIAFVGDSGDADGIHPHLHFEVHPKDGPDVDPYPYLQQARKLLFAGTPGSPFSLAVTGTIVELGNGAIELDATQVRQWPGSKLIKHDGLRVRLEADQTSADVDSVALLMGPPAALTRGKVATVFTATGKVSLAAQTAELGFLSAARVVFRDR